MDKYVDIILRADPEFAPSTLMNAVYAKLHKALVAIQAVDIGVSFPKAQTARATMGSHMRLHGSSGTLDKLMETEWLKNMYDHVGVTEIQPIPNKVSYVAVRRKQAKSSPERLRRRLIKRHGISEKEALQRIPEAAGKTLQLPFLRLQSGSTGQPFRIFIDQGKISEFHQDGDFNFFGISQTATVPWF